MKRLLLLILSICLVMGLFLVLFVFTIQPLREDPLYQPMDQDLRPPGEGQALRDTCQSLQLRLKGVQLRLVPSESNQLEVYTSPQLKKSITAKLMDGSLFFTCAQESFEENALLEIRLPKYKTLDNLSIQSQDSKVYLDGVLADQIKITANHGRLDMKNLSPKALALDLTNLKGSLQGQEISHLTMDCNGSLLQVRADQVYGLKVKAIYTNLDFYGALKGPSSCLLNYGQMTLASPLSPSTYALDLQGAKDQIQVQSKNPLPSSPLNPSAYPMVLNLQNGQMQVSFQ